MFLTALRAVGQVAAGVWLGGLVLLAIVAATTFGVMRTTGVANPNAVAGQVMAKNFVRFDYVQMICAALLVLGQAADLAMGERGPRSLARAALILLAVGLLIYSARVLTPRILDLQGAVASVDPDSAVKAAFDRFHATSVRVSQALLLILAIVNVEMALPTHRVGSPPEKDLPAQASTSESDEN